MSKKMSFTFSNEKLSLINSLKRNKSNNSKIFKNKNKFTNKEITCGGEQLYAYYFGNLNIYGNLSKNNFHKVNFNENNEKLETIENGEYNSYYFSNKKLLYELDCLKNGSINLKILPLSQKKIISKISCGCDFTFVITKNDEVYSWGKNYHGQLGLGNFNNYNEPQLISSISLNYKKKYNFDSDEINKKILKDSEYIIDVACGSIHTLISTNFNRVFSCGFGETFALGLGNNSSYNKFMEVKFFSKLELLDEKIIKIVAGISHSCCLIGNKIYIWGIHINKKKLINKIPFLYEIPEKSKVIDIQAGDLLTAVLNNKGNIFLMGNNQYGQWGTDNLNEIYYNFKKIKLDYYIDFISCGANHVIGVFYDKNYVVGWGSNIYGQLNPFDSIKFFDNPTELTWIKNNKIFKIFSGNYSTNFISFNLFKEPNLIKDNKELLKLKEKYNSLKNTYSVVFEENNKLKNEIKLIKNKINNLENANNSEVKISDLIDSNDVMKMFNKELKNSKIIKPQFEIEFSEIKFEKKISEGGFGVIWKGKWRETYVAIKILKKDLLKEDTIKDFLYEIKAMESLRHPNIVMFLGQCTKLPNLCIVLEYCSRKSLWSLLQKKEIKLSWFDKKMMALEIAKGMNYLHNNNPPVIHRDLKSLNILIDDGFKPKLGDFGWARTQGNDMTGKIGTFQWMAPEVIKSQLYSEKADVFSFGIILWEFASREPPFKEITGTQVALKVVNNNLRPTIPSNTPKPFKDLMVKCWDQNPERRPTFKKIIEDLRNFNFD